MSLYSELRRRNVFRVGAAYVVAAWLLVQVADTIFPLFGFGEAPARAVVILLAIGFVPTLIFAWVFELTPDGLKREHDVDRALSITPKTGKKLDRLIMISLVLGVTYFAVDKFLLDPARDAAREATVAEQARTQALVDSYGDRSIAVLPITSHGGGEDERFFAAGMHDDLLTKLAKVAQLRVISRTSVSGYVGTTKSISQIGKELAVRLILEGGVQMLGDRVRVNMQLIDAASDSHLWAETYDRVLSAENLLDIQEEIARNVTSAMQLTVVRESSGTGANAMTRNTEAYRLYAAGLSAMAHVDVSSNDTDLLRARDLFRSAVEQDPEFAMAWVRLADTLQDIHWRGVEEEALDKSIDALARAEVLQPGRPEIHLVRALQFYHGLLDYERALEELELAERGMPGEARVYLVRGWILRRMGRTTEAVAALKHALDFDPRNQAAIDGYAYTLLITRRYEEARATYDSAMLAFPTDWGLRAGRSTVDLRQHGDWAPMLETWLLPDAPRDSPYHEMVVAFWAWAAGDLELALDYAERAENPVTLREFFQLPDEMRAWVYRDLDRQDDADGAAQRALMQMHSVLAEKPDSPVHRLALARIHLLLGNTSDAVTVADEARAIIETGPGRKDGLLYDAFRGSYAATLCMAGRLEAAANEFEWLLSHENSSTLIYLVNFWPPCARTFIGTDHYRRLDAEFGHFSDGV